MSARGGWKTAAPLAAIVLLAIVLGGCEQGQTVAAPSNSPSTPTGSPVPTRLAAKTLVALGPRGVGSLDCGAANIAWPTDSKPIVNQIVPRRDIVEAVPLDGGPPRIVAAAKHGGDLDSPVPITEPWLVYIEYQQHLQSSSANFWFLNAVSLTTGQIVGLASATTGRPLEELPRYAVSDGRAVWDQLDSTGAPVLRLHDFGSGSTTTLGLPPGTYPVNPAIAGDKVVFVDNSTDPNSSQEDWLGRRGSLRRYDISTGQTTTLDADPTAYTVQTAGSQVVWLALPGAGASSIKTVPVAGGPVKVIGNYSGLPQTNGSIVVWYDSQTHGFMMFALQEARLVPLQLGDWPDPQGPYALCGNRLYFAVAPGYDGGTSTVRYVDLTSALQ
jgi:hypothetical protein